MTDQSLEEKRTLLSMARTFRTDIQDIQQKGAGYYSCDPFVVRFNKLLATARSLFPESGDVLLESFDEVQDTKSVDPMDKMKVTQRVIIELGQLIAFMESTIKHEEAEVGGEEKAPDKVKAQPDTAADKDEGSSETTS